MEKFEDIPSVPPRKSWRPSGRNLTLWIGAAVVAGALLSTRWQSLGHGAWHSGYELAPIETDKEAKVTHKYDLTVGFRWMNQDGARWRNVFVCNGQSPGPTLTADEGDDLELHVTNDLGAQISIHWSGMNHRRYGFWNDGTGGLNQYPILPRGNWTSKFDTTGHWGLNWYADHTGAGVADGLYGMVWVAPSPSRPRPYSMITKSKSKLRMINSAEKDIRHLALWNSDIRATDWKFNKLKGEGALSDLYCYSSILVNGKGRAFCKNPSYNKIGGQDLDAKGCLIQPGRDGHTCEPTTADFEDIETNGQPYIMMNLINIGFEHALNFSIDDHSMWVVANDAGFIEPQLVDVLHIVNGARVTVLVELDQPAADYAMRYASTSQMQNLEGFSLLRYPAKRYPLYGEPMGLPATNEKTKICLNPDSSIPEGCKGFDQSTAQVYPSKKLPKHTDLTLQWKAGSQQSEYEKHVTEFFVNEKPWQVFRAALKPVFFTENLESVEKPVQAGLPMGTVVDLIVQNTINDTIPMYKHGNPTFQLGAQAHQEFKWRSIADAVKDGAALNVHNPAMDLVHELPPLGWLALRWKVDLKGATMFHAVKLRYFALGMAAPMLEGMDHAMVDKIPMYAKSRPHVEFEPLNSGVFG